MKGSTRSVIQRKKEWSDYLKLISIEVPLTDFRKSIICICLPENVLHWAGEKENNPGIGGRGKNLHTRSDEKTKRIYSRSPFRVLRLKSQI